MAKAKETAVKEQPLKVARAALVVDEAVQSRCEVDDDTVERYVDASRDGAKFPPLRGVDDEGKIYIWDGFHRLGMYGVLGVAKVDVLVRKGTRRDAILLAAGANADHGKPRTVSDRQRAVLMLLDDEEWREKSVKWIATTACVSQHFADKVRTEHFGKPDKTKGKDGKSRPSSNATHIANAQHPARDVEKTLHVEPDAFDITPEGIAALGDATPVVKMPAAQMEDAYDRPAPERVTVSFQRRAEQNRIALVLARCRTEIIAEIRHESRAGSRINLATVQKALDDAIRTIRMGMPSAVCPACDAAEPNPDADVCEWCDGRGWIDDTRVAQLPNRLRKIVEKHLRKGA